MMEDKFNEREIRDDIEKMGERLKELHDYL